MAVKKPSLGADPLKWITSTKEPDIMDKKQPIIKVKKTGRPTKTKRVISKSSQSGLPEGWTRATFIVKEKTLEKLKDLAYTERKQLKIILNEALEGYLKGKKTIKRG